MAFNLLDSVKGLISPDLISKAASTLGETEAGVSKAVSGVVPSILGSIISKGTSDIGGAGSVLSLAKNVADSGVLGNLAGLLGSGASTAAGGINMLKTFLGDKLGSVVSSISNFAGIKESSASSLMSMVAPAALGVLGKHVTENDMTPSSLSNMLSSQKSSILGAIPGGLSSLASTIGLGSIGSAASSAAAGIRREAGSAIRSVEAAATTVERKRNWWGPLLFALLAIFLLIVLFRRCGSESTSSTTPMDTAVAAPVTAPSAPVSIKVKLPDGSELDAYKGGIEDMLVTYLNSTNSADSINHNRWFDFDNLNFKTNSAEITDESMRQVQNIAAILKAFPKVKIKIGGYTDKTGTEDANMKLSQSRADALVAALKSAGASEGQLVGAEGYGSKFATAAADAPDEERKKDRRISVSVREK